MKIHKFKKDDLVPLWFVVDTVNSEYRFNFGQDVELNVFDDKIIVYTTDYYGCLIYDVGGTTSLHFARGRKGGLMIDFSRSKNRPTDLSKECWGNGDFYFNPPISTDNPPTFDYLSLPKRA